MKLAKAIIILFSISNAMIECQPVNEGLFCQSNGDCKTGCCYDLKCRSKNTCGVLNFVQQQESIQSCVIDDQCNSSDFDKCCLNRKCVESKECFRVYTLPIVIGVSGGVSVFLIIFGVIYLYLEMKKQKSVFTDEATAEDRLIKREFPKPQKIQIKQDIPLPNQHVNQFDDLLKEQQQHIPKAVDGDMLEDLQENDNYRSKQSSPKQNKKTKPNIFASNNHLADPSESDNDYDGRSNYGDAKGAQIKKSKKKPNKPKKGFAQNRRNNSNQGANDIFGNHQNQRQQNHNDFDDDPLAFIPIDKNQEKLQQQKQQPSQFL
eukprot:403343422